VGSYRANAFGLFDMHGNVYEWCGDFYYKGFYSNSPESDPSGPSFGAERALRGGSWLDYAGFTRSANRRGSTPGDRGGSIGFRSARTP
jgi:formylglycine-generating enzyme required for sulfatase activity